VVENEAFGPRVCATALQKSDRIRRGKGRSRNEYAMNLGTAPWNDSWGAYGPGAAMLTQHFELRARRARFL